MLNTASDVCTRLSCVHNLRGGAHLDIGVRDLKQHLSAYLDRAAGGERITITERGRPKAVLGPLPGGDHVAEGIAGGWITPAEHDGPLSPAPQRFRAAMSVQAMIDEDRQDR